MRLLTFAFLLASSSATAVQPSSNDGQCQMEPDSPASSSALVQKAPAKSPKEKAHANEFRFYDGILEQEIQGSHSSFYDSMLTQVSHSSIDHFKKKFEENPDVFAGGTLIVICCCVLGAVMLVAYMTAPGKEEPRMPQMPVRAAPPPEPRKSLAGSTASVPPRPSYRDERYTSRPSTAHQPLPAVVSERPTVAPRAWCTSATACPELVVPAGSESVLAVRVMQKYPASQSAQHLDIVDLDGMPVLMAEVWPPETPSWPTFGVEAIKQSRAGSSQEQPAVILKMLEREARQSLLRHPRKARLDTGTLTLGYHGKDSAGEAAMDICSADGRLWGKLQRTRAGRFALQVGKQAQTKMIFNGHFEEHDIQVFDENNQLLAQVELCSIPTEPGSSFYRVTIQPQVDAGVMLVCLLSIDEMNAQRSVK